MVVRTNRHCDFGVVPSVAYYFIDALGLFADINKHPMP